MHNIITVFEHQTLVPKVFPQQADFQWMLAKVELGQLPCFTLGVQEGKIVLVVRHYLSVIRLPSGYILEILPKVSKTHMSMPEQTRAWVGRMLNDVYALRREILPVLANSERHSAESKPLQTWLQPFMEQWFLLLSNLQLPRHYQQIQQNNPQAQGKLLVKQQLLQNAHRPHYRYTGQQQLTLHKLWGQFFYTALVKVQSLAIFVPQTVLQSIINLGGLETTAKQITIPISQQYNSYLQLKQLLQSTSTQIDSQMQSQLSEALELALLILQVQKVSSAQPLSAQKLLPAVMINMHQAFEKWVTIKLSEKYPNRVQSQVQSTWLENPNDLSEKRTLQPDVIVKYDSNISPIKIVADVKYKHISSIKEIHSNDLYQLFTYQQHFQAKQAWLIFPKPNNMVEESVNSFEYVALGNSTHQLSLESFIIKVVLFDVKTGNFLF